MIGQIDHVTFGLFREIGQVDPEPRLNVARRMALGLPRMIRQRLITLRSLEQNTVILL